MIKIKALTEDSYISVENFLYMYPEAEVLEIDNKIIAGKCENCKNFILEGQTVICYDDSMMTCVDCSGNMSYPLYTTA